MIRVEDNKVTVVGNRSDLTFELFMIMDALLSKEVINDDMLSEITAMAIIKQMPKEEIKKAIIDKIDKMDDIGDALNMLGALNFILKEN